MAFSRITVRPDQMAGVPCIRGLRIPVATVVRMVGNGMSPAEILEVFPRLEAEDIDEAVRFAAATGQIAFTSSDRVAEIRSAQQSSGLSEEEANELAVQETRAVRRARARRRPNTTAPSLSWLDFCTRRVRAQGAWLLEYRLYFEVAQRRERARPG